MNKTEPTVTYDCIDCGKSVTNLKRYMRKPLSGPWWKRLYCKLTNQYEYHAAYRCGKCDTKLSRLLVQQFSNTIYESSKRLHSRLHPYIDARKKSITEDG